MCVDDATRLTYVEVLADEQAVTAVGVIDRAVAWFADHGVAVRQVMTDNGAPYRSHEWAAWCRAHDITHIRTRPYRPRTNGEAGAGTTPKLCQRHRARACVTRAVRP